MFAVFDPFSPEALIIVAVIALLFGAKRLPEIARSLGRSSSAFKKGLREGEEDDVPRDEAQESKVQGDASSSL